jgi:hypothetical protein
MKKGLALTVLVLLLGTTMIFGQELLDTEKHKDAEVFVMKKGYDVQQRLQEIKSIEGKKVTVYNVSGKQNKIKLTYTGTVEMADHPKFSDKDKASLITVRIKENGTMRAYFPMTNDSRYRIYLTEKME